MAYFNAVLQQHKHLAVFSNEDEKDIFVRRVMYTHANKIKDTYKTIWLKMSMLSKEVLGVCNPRHEILADKCKTSVSTVRRAISYFVEVGAITIVPRMREAKGGKGANLYLMNPLADLAELPQKQNKQKHNEQSPEQSEVNNRQEDEKPCDTKGEPLKNEKDNRFLEFKNLDFNNLNHSTEPALEDLDYTYTPSCVPNQFVNLVKEIMSSKAYKIFELWGVVKRAFDKMGKFQPNIEIAVKAFKESIFAQKYGVIQKSFESYFYGTIQGMISNHDRQNVDHDHDNANLYSDNQDNEPIEEPHYEDNPNDYGIKMIKYVRSWNHDIPDYAIKQIIIQDIMETYYMSWSEAVKVYTESLAIITGNGT